MRSSNSKNPNGTRNSIENTTISEARQQTSTLRKGPINVENLTPQDNKKQILSQTLYHFIDGVDSGAIPVT